MGKSGLILLREGTDAQSVTVMETNLVTVEWHDATSYEKVWSQKKAEKKLSLCAVKSTGYLVTVTDDYIAIAQGYDEDDYYWDFLCIPWGMVDEWYDT